MSDIEQHPDQVPGTQIPLEHLPSIDETVPPPPEHQFPAPDQIEPGKQRRWLKPVAVLAGISALGAAYLLGTRSDESTTQATTTTSTTEFEEEPTSTTETTPTTVENGNIESAKSVTVNGMEMLVGSPELSVEESLNIVAANLTTAANYADFSNQEEQTAVIEALLPYILYDVNSDLANYYRDALNSIQDYHQGDVFTEYEFSYSNLEVNESPNIPNSQEAIADLSDGVSPNPARKRITLLPKEVQTENGMETTMLLAYEQPA